MSALRYPNESKEYRDARDALLKDEQELVDKVKAVAAKRRNLPGRRRKSPGSKSARRASPASSSRCRGLLPIAPDSMSMSG